MRSCSVMNLSLIIRVTYRFVNINSKSDERHASMRVQNYLSNCLNDKQGSEREKHSRKKRRKEWRLG